MFRSTRVRLQLIAGIVFVASMCLSNAAYADSTVNVSLYTADGTPAEVAGCYISMGNDETLASTGYTDANGELSLSTTGVGVLTMFVRESLSTGDCQTGGSFLYSTDFYVEDSATVEIPVFDTIPGTRASVTGRMLDVNGDPIPDTDFLFGTRDAEYSHGEQITYTTDEDGLFSATVPSGHYSLSSQQIYSCYDSLTPLGDNEVCLRQQNFDYQLAAGESYDLGDIQQDRGIWQAVTFQLYEETSPGVFEALEADDFRVVSYELSDDTLKNYFYAGGAGNIAGNQITLSADTAVDWVFDVVAQKDNAFYTGSMAIGAPGSTVNGSITWDALAAGPQISLDGGGSSPVLDFVVTKRFDLDDSSNASLDTTFDTTTDNTFTLTNDLAITIPAHAVPDGGTGHITVELAYSFFDFFFPQEGSTYKFTIYNEADEEVTEFLKPVTITMPYDESVLTSWGADESALAPWYYDASENSRVWKHLPEPQFSIDTSANTVTFDTWHFSQFGLMFDAVDDATIRTSSGNDEVHLRYAGYAPPTKVKKVRTQKSLRRFTLRTPKNRVKGRIGITLKRPSGNVDGYVIRFSNKNGAAARVQPYKKSKRFTFRSADVKDASNENRDRLNLQATFRTHKKFYIQIRAYNDTTIGKRWGAWSKPVQVRVKKKDTGLF